MTEHRKFSIAIDGPAGVGKSTISKLLARRFGLSYVDTGAMYRGVALLAKRSGVGPDDEAALERISREAEFHFEMSADPASFLNRVFLNGEEVTEEIRAPEISQMASKVSTVSVARRELVAKQKRMGSEGGVVMEGRDICGVVLPGAEVKIFLDAGPEERAKRRFLELQSSGSEETYENVLADIIERDHRDTTRADSPLKPANDAAHVNTDGIDIKGVVEKISEVVKEKTGI